MLPRLSTFYPEQLSSLPVYFELYHTNTLKDSVCALKQTVVDVASGIELSNLTVFTKIHTDEVIPVLRNVDITEVPSGKYALTYTLLSRSMEELCNQSYLFERTNDIEVAWNPENIILNPNFQASIIGLWDVAPRHLRTSSDPAAKIVIPNFGDIALFGDKVFYLTDRGTMTDDLTKAVIKVDYKTDRGNNMVMLYIKYIWPPEAPESSLTRREISMISGFAE